MTRISFVAWTLCTTQPGVIFNEYFVRDHPFAVESELTTSSHGTRSDIPVALIVPPSQSKTSCAPSMLVLCQLVVPIARNSHIRIFQILGFLVIPYDMSRPVPVPMIRFGEQRSVSYGTYQAAF